MCDWREPGKEIQVPLGGSQLIQITNQIEQTLELQICLFSSRFKLIDGVQRHFDDWEINSTLKQKESIVFCLKDGGSVDLRTELESITEEGMLRIRFKSPENPSLDHTLADIEIKLTPDTPSFKELRKRKHHSADWIREPFYHHKLDENISVEPISESKYANGFPKTVKTPELTKEQRKWKEIREKAILEKKKERLEWWMERERERREYRRERKEELRKLKELKKKKLDEKKEENCSKNFETSVKPTEKTLKDPEASVISVKSTKKSERSVKISEKTMKDPETSVKRLEKSETSAITSKRSANRSECQSKVTETGEASECSKSGKSINSTKRTEISEETKKEEDSMNQGKEKNLEKKKKKKRRCVIS
uniref:Coilin n=1 Tax=Caenorhabditis tropicalis TaxID=1561998 RepID=A0A1I7UNW7_9PELO